MSKYTTPENEKLLSYTLIPEAYKNKVFLYSHGTYMSDEFIPPCKYFYTNSFGDKVFLRTSRRRTAQNILNSMEGEDKYRLRVVVKANVC